MVLSRDELIAQLDAAPTEAVNPKSHALDTMSALQICKVMNAEDEVAVSAVNLVLVDIGIAVEKIAESFRGGARLFYAGAGTSGRLGVLDASECPPTFGCDPELVVALIAGGQEAVFRASERAEDVDEGGRVTLADAGITEKDVLVGIAASGRTPWVSGALDMARELGAYTVLLSCVPLPALRDHADLVIAVDTGPEVLTGSTRLKAGTATKLVLNMLTTGAMVRTGKVFDNLMVDLRTGSEKLRIRAAKMVERLTDLDFDKAVIALEKGGGDVKTAVVMIRLGWDKSRARDALFQENGSLRAVLEGV